MSHNLHKCSSTRKRLIIFITGSRILLHRPVYKAIGKIPVINLIIGLLHVFEIFLYFTYFSYLFIGSLNITSRINYSKNSLIFVRIIYV